MLILTINLTNLVCCELSCANLAIAGKIRSATALVPHRIRSGPIRSTMSERCWAVHRLTAECRWLKKTQLLSKNSSQEPNSSIYVLYQIWYTSFLFSSLASSTTSTLLIRRHLSWLYREDIVEQRQITLFKRIIHLIKIRFIHLKTQTTRTQMKKEKLYYFSLKSVSASNCGFWINKTSNFLLFRT